MSSPDPKLLQAIATHQAGRIAEARVLYKRFLRRRPRDPDALNFLGMLEFQHGQKSRGIELLRKSLASAPGNPHAWMNLGKMLMGTGEPERGAEAYERATALAPDLWEAWMNRAMCLRGLRQIEGAVTCLKTTIRLKPDHDVAYERLGLILYRAGRTKELTQLYGDWVKRNPDNPTARHLFAAAAGDAMPDRASDEYVRTTFDRFADCFDENLLDLGYRAPRLVADAFKRHTRPRDGTAKPDILDAGAGTGLCGPLLRDGAGHLVGVDLSPAMLDKARERGLYDELRVAELCEFMRSRPAAFDVVVAADTLVYFGALEQAVAAAMTCLRHGGLLIFTVERWDTDDVESRYRMGAHGRYIHAARYVERVLRAAGYAPRELQPCVLRSELGTDVQGLVAVATLGAQRLTCPGTAAAQE